MDSGFRRNDGFVVNRINRLRNDDRIQTHTKSIVNSNREGFSTTPLRGVGGGAFPASLDTALAGLLGMRVFFVFLTLRRRLKDS